MPTHAPCSTMALLELRRHPLPNADIVQVERPTNVDVTVASATHPLVVHLGTGLDPAIADRALAVFDDAFEQQVTTAGFAPPLDDGAGGGDGRYDVYVIPLAASVGGLTAALDDPDANDGKHASPAFTEIDPNLPPDIFEVYAHHEFQHALQFAIDLEEPAMWYESTAVFWEIRTRPDVDDWQNSLPDFQAQSNMPIFADGASIERFATAPAPRYEYGAVLWPLYLDEVVSGGGGGPGLLLRDIWQGTAEADDVTDNEPDFIDATIASGVDIPSALADFSTWRALVGGFEQVDDGPLEHIGGEATLAVVQLNAATLDGDEELTSGSEGPFPLSCIYRGVTAPADVDAMPVEIDARATLPEQVLTLSTLIFDEATNTATRAVQGAPSDHVHASVSVPKSNILTVAVCDVSAAADPDGEFATRPIRFSMLRTDIDFPDAGTPEPDAGVEDVDAGTGPPGIDPMCSCQSAPSSSTKSPLQSWQIGLGLIGTLMGMFTLGVRTVRNRRRKNLFRRR